MFKHNISIILDLYMKKFSGKSKFVKNILLRAGFDSIWYQFK